MTISACRGVDCYNNLNISEDINLDGVEQINFIQIQEPMSGSEQLSYFLVIFFSDLVIVRFVFLEKNSNYPIAQAHKNLTGILIYMICHATYVFFKNL